MTPEERDDTARHGQIDPDCPFAGPEHDDQCMNPHCGPSIVLPLR